MLNDHDEWLRDESQKAGRTHSTPHHVFPKKAEEENRKPLKAVDEEDDGPDSPDEPAQNEWTG